MSVVDQAAHATDADAMVVDDLRIDVAARRVCLGDEEIGVRPKEFDVHINSIRRKLGERPGAVSRITTIRGVGYRLDRRQPIDP